MLVSTLLSQAAWLLSIPEAAARRHGQHARGRICVGRDNKPDKCIQSSTGAGQPVARLYTEAFVFAKHAICRLDSRPQASSCSPLAFTELLSDCQQDVLPALALYQRAVKTTADSTTPTNLGNHVAGKCGIAACQLMLSVGHSNPRDAASFVQEALCSFCTAIRMASDLLLSGSCDTGDAFLLSMGVDNDACQTCLLWVLAFTLACLHQCSRTHQDACRRDARAVLEQLLALPSVANGHDAPEPELRYLPGSGSSVCSGGPAMATSKPSSTFDRAIMQVTAALERALHSAADVSTTGAGASPTNTAAAAAASIATSIAVHQLRLALESAHAALAEALRHRGVPPPELNSTTNNGGGGGSYRAGGGDEMVRHWALSDDDRSCDGSSVRWDGCNGAGGNSMQGSGGGCEGPVEECSLRGGDVCYRCDAVAAAPAADDTVPQRAAEAGGCCSGGSKAWAAAWEPGDTAARGPGQRQWALHPPPLPPRAPLPDGADGLMASKADANERSPAPAASLVSAVDQLLLRKAGAGMTTGGGNGAATTLTDADGGSAGSSSGGGDESVITCSFSISSSDAGSMSVGVATAGNSHTHQYYGVPQLLLPTPLDDDPYELDPRSFRSECKWAVPVSYSSGRSVAAPTGTRAVAAGSAISEPGSEAGLSEAAAAALILAGDDGYGGGSGGGGGGAVSGSPFRVQLPPRRRDAVQTPPPQQQQQQLLHDGRRMVAAAALGSYPTGLQAAGLPVTPPPPSRQPQELLVLDTPFRRGGYASAAATAGAVGGGSAGEGRSLRNVRNLIPDPNALPDDDSEAAAPLRLPTPLTTTVELHCRRRQAAARSDVASAGDADGSYADGGGGASSTRTAAASLPHATPAAGISGLVSPSGYVAAAAAARVSADGGGGDKHAAAAVAGLRLKSLSISISPGAAAAATCGGDGNSSASISNRSSWQEAAAAAAAAAASAASAGVTWAPGSSAAWIGIGGSAARGGSGVGGSGGRGRRESAAAAFLSAAVGTLPSAVHAGSLTSGRPLSRGGF